MVCNNAGQAFSYFSTRDSSLVSYDFAKLNELFHLLLSECYDISDPRPFVSCAGRVPCKFDS